MNIVFWLIVVIVLVLIWFCLSFAFKGVGGAECCLKRISTARIKKRTAARTSLEAAFSWEGFSSIMRNVCIFIRVFPMDEL